MAGVLRQPLLRSRAPTPFSLLAPPQALFARPSRPPRQTRQTRQPQLVQRRHASVRRSKLAEQAPSTAMAAMGSNAQSSMIAFRIPQTFVAPAYGQYASQPRVLAKLLWAGLRARATDYVAELAVRLQSKPSFLKGAVFQPRRKALVPMAKNMHYQMLEATANGDLAALRGLLTIPHFDELQALIARRPRGQRCRWELLAYTGRPRLMSSKVILIPGSTPTYVRQIVVRIRSRQRFTWTHDAVAESPARGKHRGSPAPAPAAPRVVEKDVKENLILVASLDRETWQTAEWRIFGFIDDTTPESWVLEDRLVAEASKDDTKPMRGIQYK